MTQFHQVRAMPTASAHYKSSTLSSQKLASSIFQFVSVSTSRNAQLKTNQLDLATKVNTNMNNCHHMYIYTKCTLPLLPCIGLGHVHDRDVVYNDIEEVDVHAQLSRRLSQALESQHAWLQLFSCSPSLFTLSPVILVALRS